MMAAQCEFGCITSPGLFLAGRYCLSGRCCAGAPDVLRADDDTACTRRSATRSNFRSADLNAATCPIFATPERIPAVRLAQIRFGANKIMRLNTDCAGGGRCEIQ